MTPNLKTLITAINSLEERQSLDTLAKSNYTSVMQLERDFYNVTGYSVNEYTRRLRLSYALCLIKSTDKLLADIAYTCGFSSQQALCREIKTILGTTATEYKESSDYYFLSSLNDIIPYQVEVSKVSIPATICLRFFSHVRRGIENKAISLFLDHNPNCNKRIFGRNGKQQGNILCYELYVEETNNLNTDGFELGGKHPGYDDIFAQTRVKNIEAEINSAWDYLYSTWLPVSMFDYKGQQVMSFESKYFEEYYCKNGRSQRLKLYLPITRKKELMRISIEKIPLLYFLVSSNSDYNAEKKASREVVEYLSENYPYIIKNSKEFFFQQKEDCITCGVKINTDLNNDGALHMIKYVNQSFAVLCLNGIGMYEHSAEILIDWITINNFKASGEPFAIYDTDKSYENPQMKLYCPIENC